MDSRECSSINIDFPSNIGDFYANTENVDVVNMERDCGCWHSINVAIDRNSSLGDF